MKPILDQILNFFWLMNMVAGKISPVVLVSEIFTQFASMDWFTCNILTFNFIVLDPILNILSFNKHTHKHVRSLATLGLVDVSCGACLTWKAALTSMHLSLEGQQEHYVIASYLHIGVYKYTGMWIWFDF
ncbi:hypothetical protein ACJX0J_038489 [Zea mays]